MIDAAVMIPIYRTTDGELRIVMILRIPGLLFRIIPP